MLKRTYQFIPGNSPAMLIASPRLGSDALILDLEDSVSADEKDAARILVKNSLNKIDYSGIFTVIRINGTSTKYWKDDVSVMEQCNIDALLLPNATTSSVKELIKEMKSETKIIALIECPDAVLDVKSILQVSDQVIGVLFGAEDYSANMGIERTKEGKEIEWARNFIVINCKAQNKFCIDTPWTDTEDFEGLIKDTKYSTSIGFESKSTIAPRHIDVIHDVMSPSEKEISIALEILELNNHAKKNGLGVFSYNGKMVDKPIIIRCEKTIEKAKLMGVKI